MEQFKDFQNFPKLRRQCASGAHAFPLFARDYTYTETQFAAEILDKFRSSIPAFVLPENGLILDDSVPHVIPDRVALPFEEMTIEWSAAPEIQKSVHSKIENGNFPSANEGGKALVVIGTVVYLRQAPNNGVGAWFAYKYLVPAGVRSGEEVWGVVPYPAHLYPGSFVSSGTGTGEMARDSYYTNIDPKAAQWSDKDRLDFETSIAYPLKVLTHFLTLVNCDNIRPVRIYQPSAALRKRAIERGNLPPDEYYILNCFGSEHRDRIGRGGSHASPRFHVRRGHIRRLHNGGTTWVRQCSVGDASLGKITKDYNVLASV